MAPKKATSTSTPVKAKAVGPATPAATGLPHPGGVDGLPELVKFPLIVLLAFSFTSIAYQITSIFGGTELGSVSRKDPTFAQAAGFQVWRIFELGVGWYFGYDDLDVTALTILTRTPYYFLLTTTYAIPASKVPIYLTIDVLSASFPFTLLRRRIPQHSGRYPVPNASIIFDYGIWILTFVTASAVYAVAIGTSLRTWIPAFLVAYFEGVKTLEFAHNVQPVFLSIGFLPLGWAAETFLFSPSAAAITNLRDAKSEAFNPEVATFWETVKWNFWGWRKGTKVLISRSTVLAIMVGLSTYIKVWGTVDGAEQLGAMGWAGLWAGASLLQGPLLGWIGQVGTEPQDVVA